MIGTKMKRFYGMLFSILPVLASAANETNFVCDGACGSGISFGAIVLVVLLFAWLVAGEYFHAIYVVPAWGVVPTISLLWLIRGKMSFGYVMRESALIYILSWVLGYTILHYLHGRKSPQESSGDRSKQDGLKHESPDSQSVQPQERSPIKRSEHEPEKTLADSHSYVGKDSGDVQFNVGIVLKQIAAKGWVVEHDGTKWTMKKGKQVFYAYTPRDVGRFWADHK